MSRRGKIRAKLSEAIGGTNMVGLDRPSRPSQQVDGFVVAVGREWALLHRTMDGGFFDGHVAIRLDEVGNVREDTSFESSFARTQPEWPPTPPPRSQRIDLDTTPGLLASLLLEDELFGIERNKKLDATWIGVPHELTPRRLHLWEVGPDASWNDGPSSYRLSTIVLVKLNDHYIRGLTAVAGPPPRDAASSA